MCRAKDLLHKEELAIKVKIYRNIILKLKRKSKANHFNKYFQDNKLNIFKTWEKIREIINISKKGSNNINCIQIGRTTISNSSDIANEFNRHFTLFAKQIEEKLRKPKHYCSKYLKNPNSNFFFIAPTNIEEFLSEIKNLKKDKYSGPSSILIKFLKLLQTPLSKPILQFANVSFSTGIFSANLITANVIPLFRKDDHTSCNNYRPISLLTNIGKIIERLIHNRLMTFLNANDVLYERQLGFKHNHSTNLDAYPAITEKIRQACDSGNFA